MPIDDTALVTASIPVVSSAPLEWPHVEVQRRYFARPTVVDQPEGAPVHRILVWDEPVTCTLVVDGRTLVLDPHARSQAIIPAGASLAARPMTPAMYTKIALTTDWVCRVAADLALAETTIRADAGPADPTFVGLGGLLVGAATGQQPLDAEMLSVVAREAAIHLLHRHGWPRFERRDAAGRLPVASLARVLRLVGERLAEPLSVADLAREAGFSRSHFTRAFAASTGRPPHAYLVGRRVAKAAHLLRTSTLPLSQIAADCGFHDQAHFTRVFRRATGETPQRFRSRA